MQNVSSSLLNNMMKKFVRRIFKWMMKWLVKKPFSFLIKISSNQVNAVASMGMLLCAIYGLFLTNLPELIISNLNGEVSALKNEKQMLAEQVAMMQTEKTRLEQEQERLLDDKKHLDAAVRDATAKKQDFTRNVGMTVTKAYIEKLDGIISENQGIAEKAIQLDALYKWLNTKKERWNKADELFGEDIGKKIEYRDKGIPKPFERMYIDEEMKKYYIDLPPEEAVPFISQIQSLQEQLTLSDEHKVFSGFQMLNEAFQIPQMQLLIPEEEKRFQKIVLNYTQMQPDVFGSEMLPRLPEGWTRPELKAKGEKVLGNLERLKIAVRGLEQQLIKEYQ